MNVLISIVLLLASFATQQVQTGVVSGTVQALDGAAAGGVRVAVVVAADQVGLGTVVSSVIADENGRYRIEDIPPGRYWIIAGPLLSPTYYPGKATAEEALPVTLTAVSPAENVNFKMLTLNGRVAGKVTNLPNPVPAAMLSLLKASLREANGTDGLRPRTIQTTVRADGTFEFRFIASGEYTLTLVPSAGNVSANVTVGIRDIDNLIFRGPMYLTGNVEMEDGTALSASPHYQGTSLTGMGLYVKSSGSEPPLRAAIMADGSFSHDLPAGDEFTVSLEGAPFGVYVKSMVVGQRDLTMSSLPRGDGTTPPPMKIVLTRVRPDREPAGFTVRGRVSGDIGEGFELNFTSNASRSVRSAWFGISKDRVFEIRNVPPGTYTAQILDSSGRLLSRPPNVTTVTVTDRDVANVEVPVPLK